MKKKNYYNFGANNFWASEEDVHDEPIKEEVCDEPANEDVHDEPTKEVIEPKITEVNVPLLNMRENPMMSAAILRTVNEGTVLSILEETDEWYKVFVEGSEGYVRKEYTK